MSMPEISVPSSGRNKLPQNSTTLQRIVADPSKKSCSLNCCQLYSSIYVFLQSLRNSIQCSDYNGDIFCTSLYLLQLFNLDCQIKIPANLFLLFDVYPCVTRAYNINDEAILALLILSTNMMSWSLQ